MAYKLTSEADQDLLDIYVTGFLKFEETQAKRYFSELENCFQLLSETPLMSRERHEFIPPVRIHHHGRHLVIYITDNASILIIRVLHDSMEIKRHLSST